MIRSRYSFTIISIIVIAFIMRCMSISMHDLLVEEAYYWNYAAHLDFGYLDHPPMVALLIKFFTTLFGTHEFSVRIASILCWVITAIFSYKLTNLIRPAAGLWALMLVSVLPFFFIHSLVMTPDLPLMACWSAALYYLYKALVLEQPVAWYAAGGAIGLGLLSKYTIVLLGPAAVIFMLLRPVARKWFLSKHFYLAILLCALIFSPVIYWNITHDWASFAFQSSRRIQAPMTFSLHHLLGLFILFLTPFGVWGFIQLFKGHAALLTLQSARFLQIFTLVPICVFAVFSLCHNIKLNWIGPGLLAVVPWLSVQLAGTSTDGFFNNHKGWLRTAWVLLAVYASVILCLASGRPATIHRAFLTKFIDWEDLTKQINHVAHNVEVKSHIVPLIVPLDLYGIASEYSFYQDKLVKSRKIAHTYKIVGRDIFGYESLMYHYWSMGSILTGKPLLLVTTEPDFFSRSEVSLKVVAEDPPQMFWAHSQGLGSAIQKYYYQVVVLKDT